MYSFTVLFFCCYLISNSALPASSGPKSVRRYNAINENLTTKTKLLGLSGITTTVPQNCKFCIINDTECIEFDSDRCEFNMIAEIIADSDLTDYEIQLTDRNGTEKTDVDSIFEDMMMKAVSDESFKECIPFVSQYSDCYTENFCSGCKVCACAASGQWNCKFTQKCEVKHQLSIDHQILLTLMENLKADESDAEYEGNYLNPVEASKQSPNDHQYTVKREILSDKSIIIPENNVKDNMEERNKDASNITHEKQLIYNKGMFGDKNNTNPSTNNNTFNNSAAANANIEIRNSDKKEISTKSLINIIFNDTKDIYINGEKLDDNDEKMSVYTLMTKFQKNIAEIINQRNETTVSIDENHDSYKREVRNDKIIDNTFNSTNDDETQSNDTFDNITANFYQYKTNGENDHNSTNTEIPATLIQSTNKLILDENVEDIKEFVLYPIAQIVKEKETELSELVGIKDNLFNLLALCKRFFEAKNASSNTLTMQDNSKAFISHNNSNTMPHVKKEDSNDIPEEDELKDDLKVLLKDIMYIQKHNFDSLPSDIKSVIRSLEYYSLEFFKYDTQNKANDKNHSYPQHRPKNHTKLNCYVLKAVYNIFESLNNSTDSNLKLNSVSTTTRKVIKRIMDHNYHMFSSKPSITDENRIMIALLNIERIIIYYLKEHRNNIKLYKIKNISFILAQNIAVLKETISVIDLPQFEDIDLSKLFAYRLEKVADRIVQLLYKLHVQVIAHNYQNIKDTSPMNEIMFKTSVHNSSFVRHSNRTTQDTIDADTETVTNLININKNVTEQPNVNNTVALNPFRKLIDFLKTAKRHITKFVKDQIQKFRNLRDKRTKKLKEQEKHYEEVMKKWQKNLGITQRSRRSVKDVDRNISQAVSSMFASIFNAFASQTHKLPTMKKTV